MYYFYSKLLFYLEKFTEDIDIINFQRPDYNKRDIVLYQIFKTSV